MSIEEKLKKLKELAPLHEDISRLYHKFKEEYENILKFKKGDFPVEKSLKELEKRIDYAMSFVKRFEEKHKFFENVKKELEGSGVKFLAFVIPLTNEKIAIRVKPIDEISSISGGKYFEERNIASAMERVLNIGKLGKVAVCRPIGYLRYECEFDNKKVILDYS